MLETGCRFFPQEPETHYFKYIVCSDVYSIYSITNTNTCMYMYIIVNPELMHTVLYNFEFWDKHDLKFVMRIFDVFTQYWFEMGWFWPLGDI